jgi:hypothetical protein
MESLCLSELCNAAHLGMSMVTMKSEVPVPVAVAPLYIVIHPLDDLPEEKVNTDNLGPIPMTRTVRICLFALRGYLLLMCGLLFFRVAQLAGAIHN